MCSITYAVEYREVPQYFPTSTLTLCYVLELLASISSKNCWAKLWALFLWLFPESLHFWQYQQIRSAIIPSEGSLSLLLNVNIWEPILTNASVFLLVLDFNSGNGLKPTTQNIRSLLPSAACFRSGINLSFNSDSRASSCVYSFAFDTIIWVQGKQLVVKSPYT